jgi:hypothetical protein
VSPSLEEFVDPEGLDPAERERLRRVHELLLQAGPPTDLPASLATLTDAGAGTRGKVLVFPRRRLAAAVAFGGGYVAGDHAGTASAGKLVRVATMSGSNATAALSVHAPDANGNWPVNFTVNGLPRQSGEFAYYEIFVKYKGKLVYPCAGFRTTGATTSASFLVPYEVTNRTQWVVTAVDKNHRWPGRIVMT